MSDRLRRPGLAAVLGLALLGHALIWLPVSTSLAGLGAWLLLGLPGALLALLLFRHDVDPWALALLMLAGALALPALLLLALQALPGPFASWLLLLPCDLFSLWLGWRCLREPARFVERGSVQERRGGWQLLRTPAPWLLLILLLAASLRLPNLNQSEFQGDEARALLMAVGLRYGQPDVLLLHKKGPVEVLLPAAPLILTGRVNEGAARLPFALAGLGVVLGCFVVARQLLASEGQALSTSAALVAAAVAALDGFLIAFSRIVQYQSVLVLMSLGALYCCWRFYEGDASARRDLLVAAALAAVGLLAHYDGVYILPTLAFLVLAGAWRRRWNPRQWLLGLAPPAALGAVLVASFYLPFVRNERFGRTAEYLTERSGQASLLSFGYFYNNLPRYYNLATFYNTTFQMRWLALALLAGTLCWLLMYLRPRPLGWVCALILLTGAAIMYMQPDRFKVGDDAGNWALLPFLLPLAALLLAPGTPPALRSLLLWFGLAFAAHAFLLGKPQTHFYTMDTPAALLIGLACARLVAWLRAHRLGLLQIPLLAAGLGLAALAAPYMYIVYVRQNPPYQLVFPKARPEIYRAAYDDRLPQKGGYFGFPHNDAWKVVGALYDQGVLHGDYSSNEEELVTGWYTRGAFRCASDPVYYFIAARPRDIQDVPSKVIQRDYKLFGYVQDGSGPLMAIFSRLPVGPPQVFDLAELASAFDNAHVPNFATERSLIEILPQYRLETTWAGDLRLRGYDLDYAQLRPGMRATFSLYWQAAQPIDPAYELVVEVLDAKSQPIGKARNHCGTEPPATWASHRVVGTDFTFSPDPGLAPGSYQLRASLRNPQTGATLLLSDGTNGLVFATITVLKS